ncbi:fasciclin domain-containing protein [Desertimonas flava]|uniref:fasciclin domain-containing protein n=1 Tax=Desertimonas flava TaxID=2064846 RepID=UPI0013C51C45|nr:fasciclin domain-containing protein [Desertimonas flava]
MRTRLTRIAALSAAVAFGAVIAASVATAAGNASRPESVPPAGEPVGPGCADLPAEGDGSPAAIAALPGGDAIASSPDLSTLAAALQDSGFLDTLNGDGPFTIFAPSNVAFDKLPTAVLDSILADADLLSSLLGFHIIEGEALTGVQLGDAGTAITLEGSELTFTPGADGLTINGSAAVVCGDLPVANGILHIIDSFLQPPTSDFGGNGSSSVPSSGPNVTAVATPAEGPNGPDCATLPAEGAGSIAEAATLPLGDAIAANPLLSTFAEALTAGGFIEALNEEGPWTIFAPSNAAFEALDPSDLEAILGNTEQLTAIVTYHIVKGQSLSAANLVTSASQTSEQGGPLTFASQADGSVSINDGAATVTCSNIAVANGTIHIINTLLVPPAE